MLKYLMAYFAGVSTVTGFVVATGASSGGLVGVGFLAATIFYSLVLCASGRRQLTRLFFWISGEKAKRSMQVSLRRTTPSRSDVELDVISALVHQGASRAAATKATAHAASRAPQEFEPLFKLAIGLLN